MKDKKKSYFESNFLRFPGQETDYAEVAASLLIVDFPPPTSLKPPSPSQKSELQKKFRLSNLLLKSQSCKVFYQCYVRRCEMYFSIAEKINPAPSTSPIQSFKCNG